MKSASALASRLGFALCLILGVPVPHVVSGQTDSSPAATTNPVVIPFEPHRGQVMIPARVNGSEPLSLLLDTGYGTTMLRADHAITLGLRRTGRMTIVGIAGEEDANVFDGPKFDFAGAIWTPRRVAAFPTSEGRGRRRDGILGSGFFRRFVVEIDPRAKLIKLHEPTGYKYMGAGEILQITFKGSTPIVEATVEPSGGSVIQAQFEIDTGCTGALCLGRHFVQAHHLAPTNAPSDGSRFGVGGRTRTLSGKLAQLRLGSITVQDAPAEFFLDGSPVDAPLAGHIGWELLGDFKVILDYSRKRMMLERSK